MSALPVTDLPSDHLTAEPHKRSVAGQSLPAGHLEPDAHHGCVSGQPLDRGPTQTDAQCPGAAVDPSPHLDHKIIEVQAQNVEVGTLAGRAEPSPVHIHDAPDQHPLPDGQDRDDAQAGLAVGDPSPPADPRNSAVPTDAAVRPEDVVLAITADLLDDLERVRIATENRVRSLAQVKGLDGTPVEARMAGIVDGIRALEHGAELELRRALRSHPLGPWVRTAKGVGEKQAGRLLAAIGDPYIHGVTGEPRTVSQLWAYSGYHVLRLDQRGNDTHSRPVEADTSQGGAAGHGAADAHASIAGVAPSRARGQRANWNSAAKMRAFLVAESCLKQLCQPCVRPEGQAWADHVEGCTCSPYRIVYDEGRRRYADAVHPVACRRCGPSGSPAEPGSPLSEGHKHARALRLVAKAVLRDLWLAARVIHGTPDAQ